MGLDLRSEGALARNHERRGYLFTLKRIGTIRVKRPLAHTKSGKASRTGQTPNLTSPLLSASPPREHQVQHFATSANMSLLGKKFPGALGMYLSAGTARRVLAPYKLGD